MFLQMLQQMFYQFFYILMMAARLVIREEDEEFFEHDLYRRSIFQREPAHIFKILLNQINKLGSKDRFTNASKAQN